MDFDYPSFLVTPLTARDQNEIWTRVTMNILFLLLFCDLTCNN